jgi:hypothetical protein
MPRITAFCFILTFLIYLWNLGHHNSGLVLTTPTSTIRQLLFPKILAEEHHFIPAFDRNFYYVGRWVPTSNRLRWNTAFPGAYIDLSVKNASTIYISLNNPPNPNKVNETIEGSQYRRMNLKTLEDRANAAAPVALAATTCNGNIIHFASSQDGLLSIQLDLSPGQAECSLRVSHAGGFSQGAGVLEFSGVWLPTGATLQSRAILDSERGAGSAIAPEAYPGLSAPHRKTIELLTDSSDPVSEGSALHTTGWLAQVAARFDADQVKIPTHSHCLTEACAKRLALGITTKDLFFRSGPPGTTLFARPWHFRHYVPDVLIVDLGTVDNKWFMQSSRENGGSRTEPREIGQSRDNFISAFVSAYVALIRQIRQAAYPLHPSSRHQYALNGDGYTCNSAPSTLPIFVLRPLDGSLEQATLSVVEQMQKDGDKSVHWIDTTGWLSEVDYSLENTARTSRPLSPAGQAKVASSMDAQLCHYLAPQPESCPFLRRDNYFGSVYVPTAAELDKIIEESKTKKLSDLFWTNR